MPWLPLLATLALLPRQELVRPGAGLVALPPGPVAEALAALTPDTRPLSPGAPWPAWSDRSSEGWGGELPWRRWVELLRSERRPATRAPVHRAELAVLARLQGRDGDAWVHFLATASEPGRLAGLVPLFTPGVPQELLGLEGPLPDGVLLRPALPPTALPRAGLRGLAGTRIERTELAIGAARCELWVSVDRDGLEVGLRHLSGGAARVRLQPPVPNGIEPGVIFADWEKRPGERGPIEFRLDAEANEHSLWQTFHPRAARWPAPAPETLRPPRPGQALWVQSPGGDEAHLRRFAEALGELLECPAALHASSERPQAGLEPLVLRFEGGPEDERKLVELMGTTEAFLLQPADR